MSVLEVGDLPESVAAQLDQQTMAILVDGLNARALRVAPCLAEADGDILAEARLILLGVIKRWADTGSGAFSQQTAGPFMVSTDTRQRAGYGLWPSEQAALADLCASAGDGGDAFMVDMTPEPATGGSLASRPDLWFQWVHPTPPGAP